MSSQLHPDMTEAEYRAIPALSGTGVAEILRSPAVYRWKMDHPKESTTAMALGTLTHALVLGQEHRFVLSEFEDFRTKAAQEWRALMQTEGMEVVTQEAWDKAEAIAAAVHAHPAASEVLSTPGAAEVPVTWTEGATPCKGRIDYLAQTPGGPLVVDLKTTRSLDGFQKSIGDYGYHAQLMHYRRGVLAQGALVSPLPLIVAVENEAPHRVAVYQLSERDAAQGEAMCVEAYRRYADCVEAGMWPTGYPDGVIQTEIPEYVARQWEARVRGESNEW